MRLTRIYLVWSVLILFAIACATQGAGSQNSAPGSTNLPQQDASTTPTEPVLPLEASPTSIAPAAVESTVQPTSTPTQASTPTSEPEPTEPPAVQAQIFPDPQGFAWETIASGFDSSIGIESALDGSGRLFVVEQAGRIMLIKDGNPLPDPFLDITSQVGSSGNEQGLLGLVFHPDYEQNGYSYVNYTDRNGDTHISRFQASSNPDQADPSSERELIFVDQPAPNHNGGGLEFGPDGYLYIALGDGGGQGDPQDRAQSLETHLGKILRIDVDGGDPYAIPADNPFAGGGGLPEIWVYGLRNPWRISFDRATGDLFIGDVGQNAWEEVDFLPAGSPGGANFGWDYREGAHPYEGTPPAGLQLIDPVAEYPRSQGVAVTGGVVYRGSELPEWQGIYLYADHYTGLTWGLLRNAAGGFESQLLFQTNQLVASFGEDESGEVLIVARNGDVLKLVRR